MLTARKLTISVQPPDRGHRDVRLPIRLDLTIDARAITLDELAYGQPQLSLGELERLGWQRGRNNRPDLGFDNSERFLERHTVGWQHL